MLLSMDESDIRQQFGLRVRQIRHGKGWSQEELADRANLDRTYVGGVERGERNPGLVNIVRITTALGAPIGELFVTDGDR